MTFLGIKPAMRRRYSSEFKQQIVDLCQPGISIAGVALAHGLNVNMVRRWIQRQAILPIAVTASTSLVKLVPLSVQQSVATLDGMIEIHVERKGRLVKLRWPMSDAASLSTLLTGWLR